MAKYVFGIDLGTTYSCIAYVDENGRAVVVNNMEGTNTTPSVVNFASPTNVVVGQVAKDTAVIDPQNTVSLVKTLMGKSNFAIHYNGQDMTPEEVSSYILRKLTEDASKQLGVEVKDVVITCPAYFGSEEASATRKAGEIAGLNVLGILREPTAAALYYGCARAQEAKTILVYDLGGGTFDVTVMAISADGNIEVICADGDHDLGGKDWDTALMNYLASQFCAETGFDGDFDEYAQQDLRIKAERAKQQLTSREKVPVMVDVNGMRARIEVTRETFEEITASMLGSSMERTDAAIALAKEKGYTVDEILLVGGSTKMPQVPKALTARYGKEPRVLEPDEAVAKGAALFALGEYEEMAKKWQDAAARGELDHADEKVKEEAAKFEEAAAVSTDMVAGLSGKKMKDVVTVATTKSYALKVVIQGREVCQNMIIKNTPMRDGVASVSKRFGTVDEDQRDAELVVFETDCCEETFEVNEEFVLGTANLELPAGLSAGSPIEVTFTLNKEGILEVTGRDLVGNREVHATMQASSGATMSDADVQAAKQRSKNITIE